MKKIFTLLLALFALVSIAQKPPVVLESSFQGQEINLQKEENKNDYIILLPGNTGEGTTWMQYWWSAAIGYLFGTNTYGDLAYGQHFIVTDPYVIVGARFWIATRVGDEGVVKFTIWEMGEDGPGDVLYQESVDFVDIEGTTNLADAFEIMFAEPLSVDSDYLIGVDISELNTYEHSTGDASGEVIYGMGNVSSQLGQGGQNWLAWVKEEDGTWVNLQAYGAAGFDLDIAIFPYITGQLYEATFTVTDQNNDPIEGASVNVIEANKNTTGKIDTSVRKSNSKNSNLIRATTDENGQITFLLFDGDYTYTVTKPGYESKSGSFTIDEDDVNIHVTMIQKFDITFNVNMTDAVAEGDVVFDADVHSVFVSGTFAGWTTPGVNTKYELFPETMFVERFDTYDDFTTDVSPWINIDTHGNPTWGAGGFDFEGEASAFGWRIMNPTATTPPIDETFPPFAGNNYIFSVASNPMPPTGEENKWLISPAINVSADSELSFAARSITDQYGLERLKVYISTSGTDVDDFALISHGDYVEVPIEWTVYEYDLGAYGGQTIHFAIENVSNDAFMLFLDDFKVTNLVPANEYAIIYSTVLNATYGDYQYKYFLVEDAPTWNLGEWAGEPSRELLAEGDMIVHDTWGEYDDPGPDPKYLVTFSVSDQDGNPIDNAVITLGETTNDEGDYVFENIPSGTYGYSVTAEGYETVEGTLLVVDEDLDIDVTMTSSTTTESVLLLEQPMATSDMTAATSAVRGDINYEVADNFFNLDATANHVVFYGLYAIFDGGWANADPGDEVIFNIRFYAANAEQPDWDNPVQEYLNVPTSELNPEEPWGNGFNVWQYVVDIPDTYINNGWISIQSVGGNGWFLWHNATGGDDYAFQHNHNGKGAEFASIGAFADSKGPLEYDLAMELYGTSGDFFLVTFTVQDQNGEPIEGVHVSVSGAKDAHDASTTIMTKASLEGKGKTQNNHRNTTDANGQVIISLPSGEYNYNVSKEFYETTTGSFEVDDKDMDVLVVMEQLYEITFYLDMTDAVAEGGVAYDPAIHSVYMTGSMLDWPTPGDAGSVLLSNDLFFFPGNWANATSAVTFIWTDNGYIFGTNTYGDLAYGQVFQNDQDYEIEGAIFWIGAKHGDTGDVVFKVWDYNDGEVGNVLGSKTYSMSEIHASETLANAFVVEFDTPIAVSGDFMIGADISGLGAWEAGVYGLGNVSSGNGQGAGAGLAMLLESDESWVPVLNYGIDVDIAIFPNNYGYFDYHVATIWTPGSHIMENGVYEYKYFLVEDEPTWGLGEWPSDPNRELLVEDDMEVYDVWGVYDDIPEYQVTFHISDQDGNPIDNAVITLGETTNDEGDYVFENVLAGTYDYSVTAEGYETVEGALEVVDQDVTVTVTMEETGYQHYTLTLITDPEEGGEVTGAGVYEAGEIVTVDAIPNEGWLFVDWTDADGNLLFDEAFIEIEMPADDLVLTANFAMIDYTLALIAYPEDGGEVTGAGIYNSGDEIEVSAIPSEGWEFINWTDEHDLVISEDPSFSFSMPAEDITLIANFEDIPENLFTLTLITDPEEGGEVTGAGVYNSGDEIEVSAIPSEGWDFINWTGDTDHIDDPDAFEALVTMPDNHVVLTANFRMSDYMLTVNIVGEGTVEVDPMQEFYNMGDVIQLTATPADGWEFDNWTGDIDHIDDADASETVVTMPAQDIDLTANFQMSNYTLTINTEGAGSVDIDPEQDFYNFEDVIQLTANPATGWQFINWTGDIAYIDDPYSETEILIMPASNVNLTAHFEAVAAIATLAELRDAEPDVIVRFTGNAVIVAMDDHRNRKFIQDATAAIMIDDEPGVITTEYELYDVITDILGTINIHNQMVQFQPAANTPEATENTPVDPVVFGLDQVTSDDQAKLIEFHAVTFVGIEEDDVFENGTNYTITDGVNEFVLRTDFHNVDYIGEAIPHTPVHIAGVILQHHQTLQIVPRDADDFTTLFILKLIADPAGCNANLEGGGNYAEDEKATINATECDDYSFVRWVNHYGQTLSKSREFTYDMPAHHVTLTAKFVSETTLVDATKPQNIIIYPNPFSNSITIKHLNGINTIKLVNIYGKTIKSFANPPGEYLVITTDGLNDGVYVLLFEYDGGYRTSKTIIKGQ